MKKNNQQLNRWRIRQGPFASTNGFGNNGAFNIPYKGDDNPYTELVGLRIIVSDQLGWDHVSVSVRDTDRCPTWEEMCYIKDLVWELDECVVQYHPPMSQYVNLHNYVLHMWRAQEEPIPMPPLYMV